MPGDRLFDPSTSLSIRAPQDNASPNDKIRNPPRYMEYGGLQSANARGFGRNTMTIKTPGNTQTKVPVGHKKGKF
jgi:hypothetical protein